MSLSERLGFLRLHGRPALSFSETTAFVGRRQTEWNTVSTARLEFAPKQDGEMAGLTVFMSPQYHYDICEVRRAGRMYVQLVKQVSDMKLVAAEVPVSNGPLLLRVESTPENYQFSFAPDGGAWVPLGSGDERQIASEIANVWSGMYIGMFGVSPAPHKATPADFAWFDYRVTKDKVQEK
jgi:alpha-N-arabinofuranosidase